MELTYFEIWSFVKIWRLLHLDLFHIQYIILIWHFITDYTKFLSRAEDGLYAESYILMIVP